MDSGQGAVPEGVLQHRVEQLEELLRVANEDLQRSKPAVKQPECTKCASLRVTLSEAHARAKAAEAANTKLERTHQAECSELDAVRKALNEANLKIKELSQELLMDNVSALARAEAVEAVQAHGTHTLVPCESENY